MLVCWLQMVFNRLAGNGRHNVRREVVRNLLVGAAEDQSISSASGVRRSFPIDAVLFPEQLGRKGNVTASTTESRRELSPSRRWVKFGR